MATCTSTVLLISCSYLTSPVSCAMTTAQPSSSTRCPGFSLDVCFPFELFPTPCLSVYAANSDFLGPLFSYSYELLILQALYFDNDPHCPGGVPCRCPPQFEHSEPLARKPFTCHNLQPLFLSLPSFAHSLPLFSIACSLFFSKHRGGDTGARHLGELRLFTQGLEERVIAQETGGGRTGDRPGGWLTDWTGRIPVA
jgi:hypothetical protein